jgi:alkaline phosphatase D
MQKILLCCFLILISFIHDSFAQNVTRIAFGSCNNQNHKQPLWPIILEKKPDLFIWGGDNVYAETRDPEKIATAYKIQDSHPEYRHFKELTPIIGLWDDHDYAFDNAGGDFSFKEESKKKFLAFINEPLDSPRWKRNGIYTSYIYPSGNHKIKIILLDNRYHKDLDPNYPLLGKEQWDWLEDELKQSTASMHIIASGLSMISPKLPITDEWADYPKELLRLKKLLKKHQVRFPLLISGDKHFSSIIEKDGLIEFMSSGMTHSAPRSVRAFLRTQYKNSYFGLSFGLVEIEWHGHSPLVKLSIIDRNGRVFLRKEYN